MKFKVIYSCFGLLLGAFLLMGNSGGATAGGAGARTGAPSEGLCTNCHGGGSFTPSISIQMLNGATPISSYTAGNSYTLRVQMSGGSSYGAQATILRNSNNSTAGSLSSPSSGAAVRAFGSRSYLEHSARSSTGLFTATWVAPAAGTGTVTIYGAGIVCNNLAGSGGDNGTNGSLVLTETVTPTATITYPSASFCQSTTDPTPTIGGTQGGVFTATPAGLSINATTGAIDVSASTPNNYTITYTFTGGTATATVAINAPQTATISYSSNNICQASINPTPTITGSTGGAFSSSIGLSINSSTGVINLAASAVGNYVVTYLPAGSCATATTFNLTITAPTDAAFNYAANSYCQNQGSISPQSISNAGGTFSAPVGLNINATTGEINLPNSTVGSYNIIYTTAGSCADSDTVSLTITTTPSAVFNYASHSLFCPSIGSVSPTIIGNSGGIFTATPAGLNIDPNTGTIDLTNMTAGTYDIIYTITGACATNFAQSFNVSPQDTLNFAYNDSIYCGFPPSAPAPTINSNNGGVFSIFPNTGIIIDSLTGAINVPADSLPAFVPALYTVSFISQGNCPDTATAVIRIEICDNVNRIPTHPIKISPNPSSGQIWLDMPTLHTPAQIRIIDAQGRQVYQQQDINPQQNLDLQHLPAGIYWLYLQADRQTWQQTLRIE
jgi:hypothetical protein